MSENVILKIERLGFPWITQDPFLFCVHHLDFYPKGNDNLGPDASLAGRNIGNDFVVKDGWRMYHGDTIPGFPAHPHRGFETVTFVLQGMVDHADSNSSAGRYGNRDTQWMTAGKGLQHSEMFPLLNKNEENTFELFQIWLNLPANKKMVEPAYKMLWGETIPHLILNDQNNKTIEIDVIAGNIDKTSAPAPAQDSWAADPENEVAIWYIILEENASWEIPTTNTKVNRTLYFFEGDTININEIETASNYSVSLNAAKKARIQNGNQKSRLLLLQGKPIEEAVAQYGPFVMNNQAEIQQAFTDFQQTRFGGWPWSRTDVVHEKDKGRFASFSDGKEIIKD